MAYVPKAAVHLPLTDFQELEFHLLATRPGVTLEDFVSELVHRWLAIEKERLALRQSGPAMRGFQWKSVFLPDGTSLRMQHHQTVEFAKVVGDHIRSEEGESLTPSLMANRYAKGRNAWRCIWLRFPGQDYWIRADDYRRRLEERHLNESKS
jgi:hypothetical protein